ncbi:hypothetical protein A2U01_0048220, partial [Trifolium medium]|nr:hypothetical protein [Trifolium medium]
PEALLQNLDLRGRTFRVCLLLAESVLQTCRKDSSEAFKLPAHPVHEHHEGEPAQADDMAEGRAGHDGDDIVREMEEEELERKGDEGSSKVRHPAWVNPYEGQPVPKEFSGGPSDTS